MTDLAFAFAIILGSLVLIGMLIIAAITAKKVERETHPTSAPAKMITPEEVHAPRAGPLAEATDLNVQTPRTEAPRIPEEV